MFQCPFSINTGIRSLTRNKLPDITKRESNPGLPHYESCGILSYRATMFIKVELSLFFK